MNARRLRKLSSLSLLLVVLFLAACGRPQTAKDIYHAGLRAVHRGYNREALADFNEVVAREPGKAALYFNRAMVNYHLRRYISSESDFTTAIDLARHGDRTMDTQFLHEAHYFRGLVRVAQSKWGPARTDLLAVENVYSDDWRVWDNLGYANYRLHRYQEAIDAFTKGFQLLPNDANDHFNRGSAYFELGKYAEAIVDLTTAVKQRQGFGEAYQLRGRSYYMLHSYRLAESDFTIALHFLPKALAWDYRCETRENLGDLKGALYDCNRAVAYFPKWSTAYIDRGWVRANLGANQGALDDMHRAVHADETSAQAHKWLGWQLARMNAYHAAFAVYAHALDLVPDNPDLVNTRFALAGWLLKLQHDGVDGYGIGKINVREALEEHAPPAPIYARRKSVCAPRFGKGSEYLYDCIYNGSMEATLHKIHDEQAMVQGASINYDIEAYLHGRNEERRVSVSAASPIR